MVAASQSMKVLLNRTKFFVKNVSQNYNMSIKKHQRIWDYFILCARVLIASILLSYGWGKLTDEQFGLSVKDMATPVKKTLNFLDFLGIYLITSHLRPL